MGLEKVCDQNGDRVSKNDKSCHIYGIRLKCVLSKYEKYGTRLCMSDHLFTFCITWSLM